MGMGSAPEAHVDAGQRELIPGQQTVDTASGVRPVEHASSQGRQLHGWLRTLLLGKVATRSFGVFTASVKNGQIFYTKKVFRVPIFIDKFLMWKEMTFEDFLVPQN